MKSNSTFYNYDTFFKKVLVFSNPKQFFLILIILGLPLSGYAQKDKDIIPTIDCVKYAGNGLYQASFGYENPTKKEVVIDENGSIIKSNNGKKVAKGLNKFNEGINHKVFTKEFSANDYLEWTIISNGNEHTIVVNANSNKCEPDDRFIVPVIGNGKSYNLIGQELTAFCDNVVGDTPSDLIFQLNGDKVLIEIVPNSEQMSNLIALLTSPANFNISSSDFLLPIPTNDFYSIAAVDVYIAKTEICKLNDYPDIINFARPVYPAMTHAFGDGYTGQAVSQGDATQTTDIVRESFKLIDSEDNVLPIDGTGITIGVMSNSFDTQPFTNDSKATLDVAAGDLPGVGNTSYPEPVDVLMEYPYGVASDEGRAMMHIIHDVAPGAKLAFHAASLSPRNFEAGFKALSVDSDIIVDDITFITEPFFGEGKISEAIKAFSAAGGIHFTSAGNFADHGYQGIFNPSTSLPTTNFIDANSPTRAHLFDGSGDYLQKISVVPGTYMIALQWKETLASQDNSEGALEDLDIYIVDDFGRLLVGSNRVNIAGDPTEVIVFRATGSGEANILITSANGATNVPFRYIAFQSDGLTLLEYNDGTPTVSGHAMTENSVTVGAIRWNKSEPEIFSSHGGTLKDGTLVSVDFAAPDGVDTNVLSIGQKYFSTGAPVDETPDFPNFFGTSASAPSAAAAIALLQSALPTWFPDLSNPEKSTISASEVIQLFKDNSKGGVNATQAGAGMIDANKVFNSLAAQTARIISFYRVELDENGNPILNEDGSIPIASKDPYTIKIIGDFFPAAPAEGEPNPVKVYLDGVELIGTIQDDGSIQAIIPPFVGNPDLQIYTDPKEGSEGNGGFSEPYKFFQDGKIALTITANPADTVNEDGIITKNHVTVKYGQEYKSKLTYTVDGIELLVDETYAQAFTRLGLPEVVLSSTADNYLYPDVYNYPVTPSFGGVAYDTEKYIVNFINGDLIVEKNNLIIRPVDVVDSEFGESIEVELQYSGYGTTDAEGNYSLGLINDPDLFLQTIKEAHKSDFYDAYPGTTPVVLINNLYNDGGRDNEILNLLENGSWISSENTLLNRVSALPNRVAGLPNRVAGLPNFINVEYDHFIDYLDNYLATDGIIENRVAGLPNRISGLANGEDLLNGRVSALPNRVAGLPNRISGLANGTDLASDTDSNDYSSVFAIFDIIDVPEDCGYDDLDPCLISKFYALNLITGVEVTPQNGLPHYIFPGTFLDPMSDNFNVTYEKAELTVIKTDLTVTTTVALPITYGGDISAAISTEFDYVYDDMTENVFPTGIPYYFKNTDESDTKEYVLGDKMNVGTYNIYIRDIADNYKVVYGDSHGQLTVMEATLTVDATSAANIKYGGVPEITTVISGFPYNDDADTSNNEDASTLFPEADGGIPYFYMKQGETPDCDTCIKYYLPYQTDAHKMKVGIYDIFIKDDPNDNYKIEFAAEGGNLTVEPATLTVTTTTFIVEYGYSVSASIQTSILGFAFNDENVSTVFTDGIIPYLFVKDTDNGLDINTVEALGTYKIEVTAPVSGNYVIEYGDTHGTLTIIEATLTFDNQDLMITYGETPSVAPNFQGFAADEGESYLEVAGEMPYFFMNEGQTRDNCVDCTEYTIVSSAKMNVGKYDIFITDDLTDNYKFSDTKLGTLTINKATLYVTISPEELIVNQGDTPALTAEFTGFVNETVNDVFPTGVPYEFEDEYGDRFYDTSVPGVFTVRITNPRNYVMAYYPDATLFVNPFNDDILKVRTFADCVSANVDGTYTVTYRYENDNADPVYVALGIDNNLSGPGSLNFSGSLPSIFMSGSGTFEIGFTGEQLVWSLTTYEGTHKSSVSSASTSGANVCDAKLDGAYTIAPNPVDDILTITQNIVETSWVYVYEMSGIIVRGTNPEYKFDGTINTVTIDMYNLRSGSLYVVRIQSENGDVRSYNIIKQ